MALERRTIVVGFVDGRVERYPLRPKIEMEFERNNRCSLADPKVFERDGGTALLYQLAHLAMRKTTDAVVPNFEAWVDDIEAIDIETEKISPFVGAAVPAGSSNSQPPPA